MTSDDTHAKTVALLQTHENFGAAPGQITIVKQEKVRVAPRPRKSLFMYIEYNVALEAGCRSRNTTIVLFLVQSG